MSHVSKLTLPQPKVFAQIEAMRRQMHRKARQHGWEGYLAEVNMRAGHLLGKPPVPSPKQQARKQGLRSVGRTSDSRPASRTIAAKAFRIATG